MPGVCRSTELRNKNGKNQTNPKPRKDVESANLHNGQASLSAPLMKSSTDLHSPRGGHEGLAHFSMEYKILPDLVFTYLSSSVF